MALGLLMLSLLCTSVFATPTIPTAWVDEAEGWFKQSLKIDSASQPVMLGKEQNMVNFLTGILSTEGLPYNVYQLPIPGSTNLTMPLLVSGISGLTSSDDVMLSSHSDTVQLSNMPDALLGEVVDGYIVGRGAIDMKYRVIYDLAQLVWSKRLNLTQARGTLMAVFPGEEQGLLGVGMTPSFPFFSRFENVTVTIDEAAGLTAEVMGSTVMTVGIGERGACPFKLTVAQEDSHPCAYRPFNKNGIPILAKAYVSAVGTVFPPHYTDVNRLFLNDLENVSPQLKSTAKKLLNPATYTMEMSRLRQEDDQAAEFFAPMMSHIPSPIRFNSYVAFNVIPGHAEGDISVISIPGGMDTWDVAADELAAAIDDPSVNLTMIELPGLGLGLTRVLCAGNTLDPTDPEISLIYDSIKTEAEARMVNVSVVHGFMPAIGHCTLFKMAWGIPCVSFAPLRMPTGDHLLMNAHSDHERVLESSFREGILVHFHTIRRVVETLP